MPLRVKCPKCGSAIRIPDARRGTVGRCPKCNVKFKIPAKQSSGADPSLQGSKDASVAPPTKRKPRDRATPVRHRTERPAQVDKPVKTVGRGTPTWLYVGLGSVAGVLITAVIAVMLWPQARTENAPDEQIDLAATDRATDVQVKEDPAPQPQPQRDFDPRTLGDQLDVPQMAAKLRRIALAMHLYHDVYLEFPVAKLARKQPQWFDEQGNPHLSWRVHLLPYLDQQPLYAKFHLDEPWDSPHNKSLIQHMPDIYRASTSAESRSHMHVFTGTDAPFKPDKKTSLRTFRDGSSNTILVVCAGNDRAEIWTKPGGLKFDPNAPLSVLGKHVPHRVDCMMADGGTLFLPKTVDPQSFAALVTPQGGEIVDAASLRRKYSEYQQSTQGQIFATTDESANAAPQEASSEKDIIDKLVQLGRAMRRYHEIYRQFPVKSLPEWMDEQGTPRLSWRVHLLPFLDQEALYKEFHLDEPWDSPHNRKLLRRMPEVYRTFSGKEPKTVLHVISGADALFGSEHPPSVRRIPDGPSNTILALVTAADQAEYWTRPTGPQFSAEAPLSAIGRQLPPKIYCVMADGSPLTLPSTVAPETFAALVTPRGGEIADARALRREVPAASADGRSEQRAPTVTEDARAQSTKLKLIGLALHSHHEIYRRFGVPDNPDYFDALGKPKLSWRVHLLPYLDLVPLYREFKLDEPWNSPHNLPLLEKMPDIFRSGDQPAGVNETRIMFLTGPETVFESPKGLALRKIRDGTSFTILVVQTGADKTVPWTKPDDLSFSADNPLAGLGTAPVAGYLLLMADGQVRRLMPTVPDELFSALVTPSGGEKLEKSQLQKYGDW